MSSSFSSFSTTKNNITMNPVTEINADKGLEKVADAVEASTETLTSSAEKTLISFGQRLEEIFKIASEGSNKTLNSFENIAKLTIFVFGGIWLYKTNKRKKRR